MDKNTREGGRERQKNVLKFLEVRTVNEAVNKETRLYSIKKKIGRGRGQKRQQEERNINKYSMEEVKYEIKQHVLT